MLSLRQTSPRTKPRVKKRDHLPPELVQEANKALKEVAQDLKISRVKMAEMSSKPRRLAT
jgi:hypothetical protein